MSKERTRRILLADARDVLSEDDGEATGRWISTMISRRPGSRKNLHLKMPVDVAVKEP
jgi:hypothetical protein